MKKKHLAEIGYIFLLTAFTIYLILDTFVISSAFQENAVQMNTAIFTQLEETSLKEEIEENDTSENDSTNRRRKPDGNSKTSVSRADTQEREGSSGTSAVLSEFAEAGIASAQSYEDENISITISEYEKLGTHIYVADVVLSSAQYLKTAFAQDTYGKNITDPTSVIASEHDAILAVNGDYYGSQESGYVIRNGIVYREAGNGDNIVCIYADGSMEIVDSDDITAQELVEQGVWQAFCFGPELLENGQIVISEDEEVGKAKASNPRTAVGIIDNNHFVFVVSDGRTDESEGLSLYELAGFLESLGVTTAYNLDGGGSSTMVFQGEVINNPTSGGRIAERSISDIIYIG